MKNKIIEPHKVLISTGSKEFILCAGLFIFVINELFSEGGIAGICYIKQEDDQVLIRLSEFVTDLDFDNGESFADIIEQRWLEIVDIVEVFPFKKVEVRTDWSVSITNEGDIRCCIQFEDVEATNYVNLDRLMNALSIVTRMTVQESTNLKRDAVLSFIGTVWNEEMVIRPGDIELKTA